MNAQLPLHTRNSVLRISNTKTEATKVEVSTHSAYSIDIQDKYVKQDFLSTLQQILREAAAQRVVVLSDENVGKLIACKLITDMREVGLKVDHFFMPAGERSKSTDMLTILWKRLKELKVERRSLILGIGGGVVCDIAGLAAATYLRGLPYMLIPTSLMAQVDAAIGGKVGADFLATKNWIGGFYHPVAVTMFTEHLQTLSDEEFSNGMAELIKVATIVGDPLWKDLENIRVTSLRNDAVTLKRLISEGFVAKLRLLASDPFEVDSLDRELNFGHCLGHAVEAASGFKLRHGFAVSIGMAMAVRISHMRDICDESLVRALESRLELHNLPINLTSSLVEPSWHGVADLRKVRNGPLRMALPSSPGDVQFIDDVTFDEFKKAANA